MRDPQGTQVRGDAVRGVLAGNGFGKALRRFRPDRICEEPGCGTILSIYNDAARCWQHTPIRPYFLQAPRRRRVDSAA